MCVHNILYVSIIGKISLSIFQKITKIKTVRATYWLVVGTAVASVWNNVKISFTMIEIIYNKYKSQDGVKNTCTLNYYYLYVE